MHKSIEYGHTKGDDIWCTNLLSTDIIKVMTFGAHKNLLSMDIVKVMTFGAPKMMTDRQDDGF